MRTIKSGVSPPLAGLAVAVIAVILVAAYLVASGSPKSTMTSSSTGSASEGPLVTFSADAYAAEVTSLLDGFSQSTGVPVAPLKSGGSFADANQIAAGAPDDVFVSVALTATSSQYLKNLTSEWAVGFASDQMVLAYANTTVPAAATTIIGLADAATSSNATSDWNAFFTALAGGTVKLGISNPVSDPAGLRGFLVLEAAGSLYHGGNQQAYVAPLLQDNANVTGTNAAALVAPLQAGQIQFLFIYKSAAVHDGLPYIALDDHVNLGAASLGSFYSSVSWTDSAGTTRGSPIVLCITVPLGSVNTGEALQFVRYVVENANSLSSFGLSPFATAVLYSNADPPAAIQALVSQGLITNAGALP